MNSKPHNPYSAPTASVGSGPFTLLACAGILLTLLLYFWARLLHATRITDEAIHLGGCSDAFLDGLGSRQRTIGG